MTNPLMRLLGVRPAHERAAHRARVDAETQTLRHEVNHSIQVLRSGAQLMSTFSGINKLVREAGRAHQK